VNPDFIVLVVDDVLKGKPGTRKIQMACWTGVICPAPPEFPIGRRILAFLDRADNGWDFLPHAASYSTKTLSDSEDDDDDDDDVWLVRVREQLAIDRIADDPERLAAQVEWLVRCAEDPITRWEGAYELGRSGDYMAEYDDSPDAGFAAHLSPAQKTRLLEALFRPKRAVQGDTCLEVLLAETRDPRLLRRFVDQLVRVGPEGWATSYDVDPLIARIDRCDGRAEVSRLRAEYQTLFGSDRVLVSPQQLDQEQAARSERRRIIGELLTLYD
jgi:hypothetical protein